MSDTTKVIKVKQVVTYGGHSLSANGSVNFTLKAKYPELVNTIQLMQMLNNDVIIRARIPGQKPMKLGSFRIKSINIEGDGDSTIKFNGLNDYIEMDNLNTLPTNPGRNTEEFTVLMEAEIEEEDDNGSEE